MRLSSALLALHIGRSFLARFFSRLRLAENATSVLITIKRVWTRTAIVRMRFIGGSGHGSSPQQGLGTLNNIGDDQRWWWHHVQNKDDSRRRNWANRLSHFESNFVPFTRRGRTRPFRRLRPSYNRIVKKNYTENCKNKSKRMYEEICFSIWVNGIVHLDYIVDST